MKEIKSQRKFSISKRSFAKINRGYTQQATLEYEEYKDRLRWLAKQKAYESAASLANHARRYPKPLLPPQQVDFDRLIAETEKEELGRLRPLQTYIKDRILSWNNERAGEWELRV